MLIVDYNLGDGMTGTEVAEEFARLLGHAVPTVILTGDPANAEVPVAGRCARVGGAQATASRDAVGRAAAAGGIPARRRGRSPTLTAGSSVLRFAYSGSTRGRVLLDVLDAFLGRRVRAQEFRRRDALRQRWPSCSTA